MQRFPSPAKSGEPPGTIWRRLEEDWRAYKKARQDGDHTAMGATAARIRQLQRNLGTRQAEFPGLQAGGPQKA